MKRVALLCLFFLVFALGSGFADAVSVTVSPSFQVAFTGTTATVQIGISGLGQGTEPSLGGFQFTLTYDSSILTNPQVTFGHPVFGDQLDLSGFGSSTLVDTATSGTLTLAEVSFDSANTLNTLQDGTFVLATINFNVSAVGESALTLSNITFADAVGNTITVSPSDVSAGSITTQKLISNTGQTCATAANPINVRSEGKVEVLGDIIMSCQSPLPAQPLTITVSIQPPTVQLVPESGTPNNTTAFPFATVTTSVPTANTPVAGLTVTASQGAVTFSFTPVSLAQTFVISGIRADIADSGLSSGAAITASLLAVQGGYGITLSNDNVVLATAKNGLTAASGFTGPVLSVPSCTLTVPTPSGAPSVLSSSPDPSPDGSHSLQVSLNEGFATAWETAAGEDNLRGGLQGTRFRIALTGIPSGFTVYAPSVISSSSAGNAGAVMPSGSALVLTRIVNPAADGSGGSFTTAAPGSFENVPLSGGRATIVYEVTATDVINVVNSATIFIALTTSDNFAVGAIQGSVSFAPVGPPTLYPAHPQFAAMQSKLVAQSFVCETQLLFPWVVNTSDGSYDTGLAISNTTADVFGTTGQKGDVTLYFWPSDGSSKPSPVTISPAGGLAPGQTATFVLSQLGASFSGYIIAVCHFQLAHGFAFINNPQPGTGAPSSYQALVLRQPVSGATRTTNLPNLTETTLH